jgi:hypothetical protein
LVPRQSRVWSRRYWTSSFSLVAVEENSLGLP